MTTRTYEEVLQKLTEIADALDQDPTTLTSEMLQIISAISVKHGADPVDDSWDNVWDMFEDIREHAKNNERCIVNEDKPMQLRLGWRCTKTNKTWSIRISDFKKTAEASGVNKAKGEILLQCLRTQDGKKALTDSLNSKE
jgi:hypothetical protein